MKNAPVLKSYALVYLLFLYGPILLLPIFAFNDSKVVAFPLKGITLEWFRAMLSDESLRLAARNSLIIALSVASISTILGIFAARSSVRYKFPGKGPIMGLIMLPLVLPEMIVAMALLVLLLGIFAAIKSTTLYETIYATDFAKEWLVPFGLSADLSLITVIMGHVLICTPFAVAILTSTFQSIDRSLEEAALDLGETQASTFRLIVLPLVMPGIIASFLICFIISFDEYIIASFLGSGEPILSVYIFGQFRFPASVPSMMALGTVLVCFSIILLGFAEYMRRRGIAKAGGKDSGGFL